MNLQLTKGSRSRILAGLLLGIAAIFVVRLFYLQIIKYGYYRDLANAQQIKELTIPAQRGLIYAMNGSTPVPLVLNQTVYTIFADDTVVSDKTGVINALNKYAANYEQPNLSDLLNVKGSRYEILAKSVPLDQTQQIKSLGFSGIGFQAMSQRVYPEGSMAAQVLGFVDANGNGQYGIEQGMNSELAGKPGLLKSVTDVADVPLTIGSQNIDRPPVNGKNIVLSIDRNVQAEVEKALVAGVQKVGATYGSAIVMNPQNGRVLAMANVPSYNPATYYNVANPADYNNNIISRPYEPGSDIKTFMMSTAVDVGAAHAMDTYDNTGVVNVDGILIHNAPGDKYFGNITFQEALDYSLNTGFVTVAERVGGGSITYKARQIMYDYYHNRFRFGQLTGIPLANEVPGIIIPPNAPSGQGNAVRYSNMAFGQGFDATMLQVAAGFDAIVNGGTYYKPTILAGTIDADGNFDPMQPPAGQRILKASTSAEVKQMMITARHTVKPHEDPTGYDGQIGGKTGTSQVAIAGGYSTTSTEGTYLGFGGSKTTPQYVIMVELWGPNEIMAGEQDSEPIFNVISNWMLTYDGIAPGN